MNKNIKSIFFVLTLFTLLVGVSAISATEVSDDTSMIEDTSDNIAPEIATTTNDNSVETTNNLQKTDKNLKTETKVVEVNAAKDLREWTKAVNNSEYDEWILNMHINFSLGNGAYKPGLYSPNTIFNGNNNLIYTSNTQTREFAYNCNTTFNDVIMNASLKNRVNMTFNNVVANRSIINYEEGILVVNNSTLNLQITNYGKLVISDDTIFGENFGLTNNGEIIMNDTSKLLAYRPVYDGDYVLENFTLNSDKTNTGNLTVNNCIINGKFDNSNDTDLIINNSTINNLINNEGTLTLNNSIVNSTINNYGTIYIDNNTIITDNAQIIGLGDIVTNDITKLLPYIESINGNWTITDISLNKSYNFNGNISLNNCNITTENNVNFGILNINNSNIIVDEKSKWITNYGLIVIDNITTTGDITNYGEVYEENIPEDYVYDNTYHIINNDTIKIYFDTTKANNLSILVKEGDTLDFQGTIGGVTGLSSLVINKPVNIITSTNDGRIENFSGITYNNGASGSNITGLYTYNTQFYVRNAHNMVFDNISNVVVSKAIGWGVGQTSIGHNSTNILVKNSYFYTKDNGGSSTFVFNWADNSTLVNSTVEADGNVGNLVYLTTYNVDIPSGTIANCNNQILNNIIIGPETPAAICWGIVLSGANNNIANNRIYYVGSGIVNQWGSGITGEGVDDNETSLVTIENNTLTNNTHIKHKPTNELIIDTTTFTPGETTTITATIRFTMQALTDINKGKVTFKVNGKTLKDTNGKVIYAKVVNGTATIENYIVPDTWKEGSIIEAVYSGSTQCDKLTSEKTEITLNKEAPTFTIDPVEPATIGSTITLKATITDNNKEINTGKVVFKINGKTVKDANGKVIYAKIVNNTVIVEYTLPDSYKAKDYNITAVLISPDYERLEDSKTLTVN